MDLDEYLDAIGAGDTIAFGLWASRAEATLRAALRGMAERVDTESVMQETLLRVWNVAGRVERRGPNSLLRLAIRIARNLAISEIRKRSREIPWPGGDSDDEPPGPVGPDPPDPFLRMRIKLCLAELSEKPRAALEARIRDGGARPDRDLASVLRMGLNTFHQNIGRARRLLRECLRRYGIEVA